MNLKLNTAVKYKVKELSIVGKIQLFATLLWLDYLFKILPFSFINTTISNELFIRLRKPALIKPAHEKNLSINASGEGAAIKSSAKNLILSSGKVYAPDAPKI